MDTTAAEPTPRPDVGGPPGETDTLVLVALALAVVLAFAAVVLAWLAFDRAGGRSDDVVEAPAAADQVAAPSAAIAYERVAPSFVIVRVDRGPTGANAARADKGLGSGVVVNSSGAVVTALHVVSDADRITVQFADGTESDAVVVDEDPARDLAVLRAERVPAQVSAAVIASTNGLAIGDPVFVVGNPLGLTASITAGVVSGLDRTIPVDDASSLVGLVQFDAAVNPGNSGGPLVDAEGHVIGIVTALANPTDQSFFSGIAFAVPVGFAADMAGRPDQ